MSRAGDLRERVRRAIVERGLIAPGERLVVGVSGGPDSLALLSLLHALASDLGISLCVAHLDHGLRGQYSEADAEFVRGIAMQWGLPVTVERRDVAGFAKKHHLSLEEAGRAVRYRFLAD